MLKQGWLNRQIQNASEDVKSWPSWMKREAKLEESKEVPKEIRRPIKPPVFIGIKNTNPLDLVWAYGRKRLHKQVG